MAGIPKSWNKQPQPVTQATAPRATTSTGPSRTTVRVTPRESRTAYYNPARIIDRSQIDIVDSIAEARKAAAEQREFSDERGDISIATPDTFTKPLPPVAAKKPVDIKLLVGALATYFLLF